MSDARVASLHVYPVKGCAGLAPLQATVGVTGLVTEGAGDREWMVVDPDGRFVTQREFPRMSLVHTQLSEGTLTLRAAGKEPLQVLGNHSAARDVVVWSSNVRGFDEGDAAAAWISSWLDTDLRLVRFDPSLQRVCNPEFAGDSGAHTMFADGYPILVIGEGSLAELNGRLAERDEPPLPMNRFRPSIVLSGLPAFAEDHVDTFTIGGVVLRAVKPCVRCQVTTTDQVTATVGIEPLRTLGEFRMDERLGGVTFGMNAIVVEGAGSSIAPGADVDVDYRF